ncbi:hypothetical protein LTR78_010899 [Recurvomyces mirabilis]|uniref:NTF2-like domain-containing protein n=1 Tax=Recurvomyces mirabilis TaxID=574656 RepID=A0AAE0TLK6_9PEZI|nr:hypothetical protein LTR78_010899 [Recurvomyces mirabilis]KAK5151702.1 hypothetical protein LTS14_009189 [Recurvomyces mirabilis]
MYFSTTIAGVIAFTAAAFATAIEDRDSCVSQWEAEQVVNKIISVFGHQAGASQTANARLAENFITGDGATANKQQWSAGILGEPPTVDIDTLFVGVTGCNKTVWYWQFNQVARAIYRVRGFNLFHVEQAVPDFRAGSGV